MRIAIISDMHGNCVALDAVLADLRDEPIDRMICLGDAIQGGPQPAEVVARLREAACPTVMGNADDWLLTGQDSGAEQIDDERQRVMDEVRAWSLAQLNDDDRALIAQFEPLVEVELDEQRKLIGFHGSPHSYDDVILPNTPADELQRMLGGFEPHILAGGHTHVQQIHQLGIAFYFGCGSVGFAYRHAQPGDQFRADPWAEYAVLTADGANIRVELRRVPFDVDALIAVYRHSGRPNAEAAIAQYGAM